MRAARDSVSEMRGAICTKRVPSQGLPGIFSNGNQLLSYLVFGRMSQRRCHCNCVSRELPCRLHGPGFLEFLPEKQLHAAQRPTGNPVSNVEVEKSSTGEKRLTDSNGDAWFTAELDEKSAADTFKGTKQYYNQDVVLVRTKYHSFCSDMCSMKAYALAMSHGHKQGGPKPKPPKEQPPGGKMPRLNPKEPRLPPKVDTLQIVDAETKEVLQEKQFIDSATGSAKALQGVERTDKGYVVGTEDSNFSSSTTIWVS